MRYIHTGSFAYNPRRYEVNVQDTHTTSTYRHHQHRPTTRFTDVLLTFEGQHTYTIHETSRMAVYSLLRASTHTDKIVPAGVDWT